MTFIFRFWERVASMETRRTTSRWSLSSLIMRILSRVMGAIEFNISDLHYLLMSLILLSTPLLNTQSMVLRMSEIYSYNVARIIIAN